MCSHRNDHSHGYQSPGRGRFKRPSTRVAPSFWHSGDAFSFTRFGVYGRIAWVPWGSVANTMDRLLTSCPALIRAS